MGLHMGDGFKCSKDGRDERAIKSFEKLLSLMPAGETWAILPDVYKSKALCHERLGEQEEARSSRQEARRCKERGFSTNKDDA